MTEEPTHYNCCCDICASRFRENKRIRKLEKALAEERARVLYFAHAGDDMYDVDVLGESDMLKERHIQEAREQLHEEGIL